MYFKNKIWIWLVAILLATNIATVVSVIYHLKQEGEKEGKAIVVEVPGEQRTRFFKDQLGLSDSQLDHFWNANRNFNRNARQITNELEILRQELVNEMAKDSSSEERLSQIAKMIGEQHEQLKVATYTFYLQLKEVCNEDQKEKLAEIFKSLIGSDKNINLPQRQRGKFGNGR